MTTCRARIDYIVSRAQWVILHVQIDDRLGTMPKYRYFDMRSEVIDAIKACNPSVADVTLEKRDVCEEEVHSIQTASKLGESQDGRSVFLLCGCKRKRKIPRATYEAALQP